MKNHFGIEIRLGQGNLEKKKITTRYMVPKVCDVCGKRFLPPKGEVERRNRNRCSSCIAEVNRLYRINTSYRGIEIR